MNTKPVIKIEYRYIVAIIYAIVLFLDRLDLTIVNIILPTVARYFDVAITKTEWVNNAYLLALAISIPVSGWAGDYFGTKKTFIIATTLFGLSSFLCAFSPNLLFMVIMRFIQGLGGGMIIPVGMTMVYRAFDVEEYASITSYIFIPTLIAPAIAPALGGVIEYLFNWQWVFLFVVPICFVAVVLSILILKEHQSDHKPPLDWGGFILSSIALILILGFISYIGKSGINYKTTVILIAALCFSYFFLRHEKNKAFPLIDVKFFKSPLFLQANLIQLAFQICHFGSIFLIGMYLQVGVGMSAMVAGLIMGMQALGAICTSRLSVKFFNYYGASIPIIIGFIGVGLITPCILLLATPQMWLIGLIILFVRGLFSGLCGTPIQTISVIGFSKEDVSRASAIFNAGRQVSISLGIALSSLLIAYGFKSYGLNLNYAITKVNRIIFFDAFIFISFICLIGIIMTMQVNNKEISLLTPPLSHRLWRCE